MNGNRGESLFCNNLLLDTLKEFPVRAEKRESWVHKNWYFMQEALSG